jgi:hypothetical protein
MLNLFPSRLEEFGLVEEDSQRTLKRMSQRAVRLGNHAVHKWQLQIAASCTSRENDKAETE